TTSNPRYLSRLRAWTHDVLIRLAQEGRYGLTPKHLAETADRSLLPQNRERVARALCEYLANSGEFSYSLNLRRQNRKIDPVLDFLTTVKQGHCERFASALALTLRSQGIPTRVVKGFRGAESQGDGTYVVRQSHAHSWVEALVPAEAVNGRLAWLTLDPTPGNEAGAENGFGWARFWDQALINADYFWRA